MHEKPCSICGKPLEVDQFDQGECKNCGWYNSPFDDASKFASKFPNIYLMQIDNTDIVIYPNMVSQNKAKRLYQEGKPFTPSLDDFMGMLYFYSEVEFRYSNKDCELSFTKDTRIIFGWSPESVTCFNGKEDFIQNAKIGDEYVRDIWDKVEDPRYI